MNEVFCACGFSADASVTPHGTCPINRTLLVRSDKGSYILQQLNRQVFARPQLIADNIEIVGQYLADHYPTTIFPRPVRSLAGQTLVDAGDDSHYRLYP